MSPEAEWQRPLEAEFGLTFFVTRFCLLHFDTLLRHTSHHEQGIFIAVSGSVLIQCHDVKSGLRAILWKDSMVHSRRILSPV